MTSAVTQYGNILGEFLCSVECHFCETWRGSVTLI